MPKQTTTDIFHRLNCLRTGFSFLHQTEFPAFLLETSLPITAIEKHAAAIMNKAETHSRTFQRLATQPSESLSSTASGWQKQP
jgi:hypothetical protein